MTKEQVISFVKSELECGNSILAATLGNGGAVGFGTFDKNPVEAVDVTADKRTVAWVALDGNWGRVTHNIFHAFQGEQSKQLRHLSEYLTSNLKTELQLRQRITEITISKGTPLWK